MGRTYDDLTAALSAIARLSKLSAAPPVLSEEDVSRASGLDINRLLETLTTLARLGHVRRDVGGGVRLTTAQEQAEWRRHFFG